MELFKHGGRLFKELLDTHGRIVTLGVIVVALGGGAFVTAVTRAWANVHGLFLVAVALLATGLFIVFAGIAASRLPSVVATPNNVNGEQVEQLQGQPLRTRTLALVDEIRAWLKELGPRPHEEYSSGMSPEEFIKANWNGFIVWFDRYYHGFHLRFAERAEKLYHEFGLRSLKDDDLAKALVNEAKDPGDAQTIADSLAGLASKLEGD